ncbi:N-acetyltransferase family protein [Brevibacillus fluminis]|uniref:GNAT family N-acetyltransferase n=1 Tax=Brevibacillus fluminis TaxID=511487 RepID=UPI003F8A43EC
MIIDKREFHVKGVCYTIRSADAADAAQLSALRVKIDGETENMDREKGEAFIDAPGFEQLIKADAEASRNLFLVAAVDDRLVGFSRCQGSELKRLAHKVEFGVCVLQQFWGCGIGQNLLKESIAWADSTGVRKITLSVLETNEKAIALYQKLGFAVEGVLKKDKLLSDGNYYDTIVMGRFRE